MLNGTDTARARDAFYSIPPDLPRDQWVKVGMAAHAAGLPFDDFDAWSSQGATYNAKACRSTWRSFKAGKGIGAGTLFAIASEYGAQPSPKPLRKPPEPPPRLRAGMSATEIWNRCQDATSAHPYVVKKDAVGVPLNNLRVVPADDPLTIQGERMAGALVVPVLKPDGTLSSLQFITPPETAERLKAKELNDKPNLPGHQMQGWFTVGELEPGAVAYIVEGIGTAWACWQATGAAAVVSFGAGRMSNVAKAVRELDPTARIVLVPDVGKETQAAAIAADVSGLVAAMPAGWEQNDDANDLAQRDGLDVLAALLDAASEPAKPEPRYKLLSGADLAALPPVQWRVRNVLPAVGLAGLYGPSASGKSFLAWDMAAAIAEGAAWFGNRVEAAPVVYAALEGEAGFKLRAQAWEKSRSQDLPDGLSLILQPFKLTEPQDVQDLAAVVPAGAVVFIDTLNRAAPTADENSSKDMGEILSAAKELQRRINGLVVLVHHTGKDTTKGLRGHSSLFAALDAAVEVSRDGERREWRVAKSKDGQDGDCRPFMLKVETLGADEYGDAITSCTVQADMRADEIRRARLPQGRNQKLVYEGIRGMFKDGATGKTGAPPMRPCIELEAAVSAGAARLTCPSDKKTSRARDAIAGLVSSGVLGLNEGWLWTA
ncbi:MAG: AAA family ATPase [Pseudomonadota bacterium]